MMIIGSCYNHFMLEPNSDTHPKIQAMLDEMMSRATPAQKAHMVGQMYLTVTTLMLAGLRHRHPHDTEPMLRRRMADQLLGPELAQKVYGPTVDEE
jgi:hypothetical protein